MIELPEEQKEIIKKLIAQNNPYLIRKYIDRLTDSISDVWSIDDVIDYCFDHAEIQCTNEQALEVLDYMESRHDCNFGYTWDGMVNAVEKIIEDKL